MSTGKHIRRAIGLLASFALVATLAASATAAGRPAGMSEDAYAALAARSQALNRLYGLGDHAVATAAAVPEGMSRQAYEALMARSRALNEAYGTAATKMSAAAFQALYERSVALNKAHHLGDYAQPTAAAPATTGGGFDWTTVGVGLAAALGLLLLATAGISTRGRWHPPARPSH